MSHLVQIGKNAERILDNVNLPQNSAVVFDIDGTLLDDKNSRQTLSPIVSLYNYVRRRGITPIIVTARILSKDNVRITLEQLRNRTAGIIGFESIYFRPPNMMDATAYKRQARKHIQERGYKIVMSIGDNSCDVGEYGGIGILLR